MLYANIPNFITLARVLSVPVIFWLLINDHSRIAFFVFVCAGISDAIDGYLAKRFNWTTELGAYLDPLADKLLIVSIYIALAVSREIPMWLVIAVVSRDILILLAVLLSWLLDHPVRIKPLAVSKLNTVAQIVLAATVLADERLRPRPRHDALRPGVDYGGAHHPFARRLPQGLASAHDGL